MQPILYSFRRCPYAMRARLALDASRQSCELREVALKNKPEAMLLASPKATVPVLVLEDGRVIDESIDIMRWALERNDPAQWLVPDFESSTAMHALIAHMDTHFKQHLDRYKYPLRFAGADPIASRTRGGDDLLRLDRQLEGRRYLYGERASLADMAIAPFVRQFASVDAQWFNDQPWTGVRTWLDNIVKSARFVRIMRPLTPWIPGTCGVAFPFQ